MKVDINAYAANNRDFIQKWFLKNKSKISEGWAISMMACVTMVPCIVVAFWIGEINGWSPEVKSTVDRLTKDYGYKEIVNKPEGCPW